MGRYVQPEIRDHLCERENPGAAGQPSTNTLRRVVNLLVENRIKLDALEHVLKETNPLVQEAEVNRVLAQTLESQPADS